MKACKTIVLVAGVFVALFGLTPKVWAGGGSAGFICPASVLVANLGQGTVTLRGTVAAEAVALLDTDFILRLARAGSTTFTRYHDGDTDYTGLTNDQILCKLIAQNPDLVTTVLDGFKLDSSVWKLVVTASSVSNATDPDVIPGTSRVSGIADVTIYAVRR